MTQTIAVPIWFFILVSGIAAWFCLDHILLPSARWLLRKRVNRIIAEINARLDIEIRPFQLTKRQVLIDRLIFDGKVIEAVHQYARDNNAPLEVAQSKVLLYAKEIVPSFNAYLYFRFGYWIAKKIARLLYRVRVGFLDNDKIAAIDPSSTVVFVMNHRSNMDYILVSFLAAERTTLSYAVGEWARIWPLQSLVRAMGAFFVRRNSRNPLYRRVLERYVNMATQEGVCQAVFLEGGLSKDGLLRPPKMGFIDYMVRNFHADSDRDIVFIPVGINYDRTLEDRSLLRRLDNSAEQRSVWFVMATSARFIWHNFSLISKSRWRRFGYAAVNFGQPLSLRHYCESRAIYFNQLEQQVRFTEVEKLATELMAAIRDVVPVLPVALLASVLLTQGDHWQSSLDLKAQVRDLLNQLANKQAPIMLPLRTRDHVLNTALNMLALRHIVETSDDLYRRAPDSIPILRYYANAIIQWA